MATDEDRTVYTANGHPEAEHVRSFLEAHDIRCELRGEALAKVHGFTLNGLGAIKIVVGPQDVDKARDLLARARAGEFELSGPPEA